MISIVLPNYHTCIQGVTVGTFFVRLKEVYAGLGYILI